MGNLLSRAPVALVIAASACDPAPVERVGADTAAAAAVVTCRPRGDTSILGASPAGELWLATAGGTRILDLAGGDRTIAASLADASAVQPWDGAQASIVVDGALWTWRDGEREHVMLPDAVGRVRAACGPPAAEHGAFVATDRGLFERIGAQWWQWSAEGRPVAAASDLLAVDGACARRDDTVWFATDDGGLWHLSRTRAGRARDDAAAVELAAVPGGIAVRDADGLRLGPDWRDVFFDGGEVGAIDATGERLWAAAGDAVYVRTRATWLRVDGLPAAAPTAIAAHAAGGAWIAYADELCHAAIDPAIVVDGLRPFERRLARTAAIAVRLPGQPDQAATIERDGEAIATADVTDGVAAVDLPLGPVGWHRLVVRTAGAERRLDYYLVPAATRSWAADVEPLFRAYCAGGPCHGPSPGGGRPDLSTYDGWRTRAPLIKARLVAGTMPPADPRPSPAELDVLLEWIEGGLQP